MAALMLPAMVVSASARDDYAWQWPLDLSSSTAGAYQVTLDASVYRQIQDPGLADLAVLDANGEPMPASLFVTGASAPGLRTVDLAWFPLPMPVARDGSREHAWELVREVGADGSLRAVAARVIDQARADALPRALLVDLGAQRDAVTALELEWRSADALDLAYRVEASDDLDAWHALPVRARLVDLKHDGQQLLRRRIDLAGAVAAGKVTRYLRLLPEDPAQAPEVLAVRAELTLPIAKDAPAWVELEGRRSRADGRTVVEYQLDGRFPIQQLDVTLPGNHAVEWRVESRDGASGDWRWRAGPWMAYRLEGADQAGQSPPRQLSTPVRDRYWRLTSPVRVHGDPLLRLGYWPEAMVFLPARSGPHFLVAGRARPGVDGGAVWQLVETLRKRHGADWQPAPAILGQPSVRAGDAALTPRRDWTTWVLWAVLVLGGVIVVGLAVRVLRAPPASV